MNTYAYVGGNPLNTIDPLGLYWEMINGVPQWVPDGPDGSMEPINVFDLYPMPGSSEIDAGELADYLSTLEREEYGDRLIEHFAYTGAPGVCIRDVDVAEQFRSGLSRLSNNSGLPSIVYGDTIDGILAQYTNQPWRTGAIGSWVRNGNELQYLYPELSDNQVEVLGIAIEDLPDYNGQSMQIAIPAGASDEQIAEELMRSLGGLLTAEDVAALLANLPEERNGPLLVDIYELYQEILARYQTRLHSDDRVWHAEIDANNAQEELAAHIAEYGEILDCESEVPQTDLSVCQRRDALENQAEESLNSYLDVLQTVNNEMIDNGMMPLMDVQMSRQSEAREMFTAATVAAVGVFVPLTLEDAAIDVVTAGLGRIRRVGEALADMARVVRGVGRAALNRVRNITDNVVERVGNLRTGQRTQLLVDGNVPGVANGAFNRWFDELTPRQLDELWSDTTIRRVIERRIREPRGLHEWCMACRAPTFRRWGVSMDEIKRFRTRTTELTWIHPETGVPGGHGGDGSGLFHNELKAIIDNSSTLEEFNNAIIQLRDRWQIDPNLLPTLIGH
jgi:hypothetical protein